MKDKIADDGYAAMFGLFFTVMVCKGILVSMAGAAPITTCNGFWHRRRPGKPV